MNEFAHVMREGGESFSKIDAIKIYNDVNWQHESVIQSFKIVAIHHVNFVYNLLIGKNRNHRQKLIVSSENLFSYEIFS